MTQRVIASGVLWRLAFLASVAANLVALYWPRPVSEGGIPHVDKLGHVLVFAAVAWTGLRAGVPARALLPLLAGHAVLSEVAQATVLTRRSGDLADVAADLAGILVGMLPARASWRSEHPRAE